MGFIHQLRNYMEGFSIGHGVLITHDPTMILEGVNKNQGSGGYNGYTINNSQ